MTPQRNIRKFLLKSENCSSFFDFSALLYKRQAYVKVTETMDTGGE